MKDSYDLITELRCTMFNSSEGVLLCRIWSRPATNPINVSCGNQSQWKTQRELSLGCWWLGCLLYCCKGTINTIVLFTWRLIPYCELLKHKMCKRSFMQLEEHFRRKLGEEFKTTCVISYTTQVHIQQMVVLA